MIRIAWYDRTINKYDFATLHSIETLDRKLKWVKIQNEKFPNVYHWVEFVEQDLSGNIVCAKNIEGKKFIKVDFLTEENEINETDYLLI
jgi:hypothetical protein